MRQDCVERLLGVGPTGQTVRFPIKSPISSRFVCFDSYQDVFPCGGGLVAGSSEWEAKAIGATHPAVPGSTVHSFISGVVYCRDKAGVLAYSAMSWDISYFFPCLPR